MKKYAHIVLLFFLTACSQQPDFDIALHECAPMPSPRASSTCFVVNGQAYVFAGRDSVGHSLNDLWRYSPSTDEWENLGTTPLTKRVNATACVVGDKVYLGLGFFGKYSQDSSYLRDWWEYIPETQQWTRLADYPNFYTDDATSFVGNGELYVGYGFCWNYRRDMFRYDIASDTWDSIDVHVSFHGYPTRSFGGTGCTCQGRHFIGTGYYQYSLDWWAELVDGTHWEKRAPVPGKTRTTAASTATDDYVYLCGGLHYGGVNTTGEVLRDIRRYDPQRDSWQYVAILPEGLFNHICFSIGKRVYIGLGETKEWQVKGTMYYFEE